MILLTRNCGGCKTRKFLSRFGRLRVTRNRRGNLKSRPYWRYDYRCKDCRAEYGRKYRASGKITTEMRRIWKWKAKYGLSLEEYQELYDKQKGRCASCGKKRKLVVDHCHTSGKVRALLCGGCNTALGMLEENPELLERLASYIRRFANATSA